MCPRIGKTVLSTVTPQVMLVCGEFEDSQADKGSLRPGQDHGPALRSLVCQLVQGEGAEAVHRRGLQSDAHGDDL